MCMGGTVQRVSVLVVIRVTTTGVRVVLGF